jgi:hypothetical protein
VFVDSLGAKRTLDLLSAPFGLSAKDVRETALAAEVVDDAGAPTGVRVYAMHPVLSMESRVHNVMGLATTAAINSRSPTDHEEGPRIASCVTAPIGER